MGGVRDARHTYRHERPGSGHETPDVVADIVDTYVWQARLRPRRHLNPRAVIAGHKRPGNDDSPKIIEETRQYIRDFDRVAGTTTTARGLYDKMLELYPDRVNPGGALWLSARAVKP